MTGVAFPLRDTEGATAPEAVIDPPPLEMGARKREKVPFELHTTLGHCSSLMKWVFTKKMHLLFEDEQWVGYHLICH